MAAYKEALPEREWLALQAWLGAFYPFQLELILDQSPASIILKSRQIGLSFSTAASVVLWAAFLGETSSLLSKGQTESFEILRFAKMHSEVLVSLGSRLAVAKAHDIYLDFASGGRLIALPNTSGGRAFSGHAFLDEFAYIERPEETFDAAAGSTTHGGYLRIGSTPNGVGNLFHKLWSDPSANKGWSRHYLPMARAIAEGMPVDLEACMQKAHGDTRVFAQLYECEFLDGNMQYIPTALIDGCLVADPEAGAGSFFAGLDVGRTSDKTVLYVVRKGDDGIRWVVYKEALKRTEPADLARLVAMAMNDFHCSRLAIDATGMGEFPAAEFQKTYGEHHIDAVKFGLQSKELLATGLYQACANKTVRIVQSDEPLRNALCSLRRIVTQNGNVRYDAPHTDEGHADEAWALALALHASAHNVGGFTTHGEDELIDGN